MDIEMLQASIGVAVAGVAITFAIAGIVAFFKLLFGIGKTQADHDD